MFEFLFSKQATSLQTQEASEGTKVYSSWEVIYIYIYTMGKGSYPDPLGFISFIQMSNWEGQNLLLKGPAVEIMVVSQPSDQ